MKTLANKIEKLNSDEITFIMFGIMVIALVSLAVVFNANSMDQLNSTITSYGK